MPRNASARLVSDCCDTASGLQPAGGRVLGDPTTAHRRAEEHTVSHITTAAPTRIALGTDRRRFLRYGAGAACVAALIAGGGYAATQTFGPDAYDPVSVPSQQVLQQQHESLAGQYGSASAVAGTIATDAQLRSIHESVAGQYGSASAVAGTIATDSQLRSIHESLAGQYGTAPATRAGREPSAAQLQEIRRNAARQYGSRPAAPSTGEPSASQLRQIRDGLARVHGGAR
jgi:hypothetical protein